MHPACGAPLEKAVKIVAVVSLFFTCCLISLEIFLLVNYGPPVSPDFDAEFPDSRANLQNLVDPTTISPHFSISNPQNNTFYNVSESLKNNSSNSSPPPPPPPDRASENIQRLFKITPKGFKVVTAVWFLSWSLDIGLSILLFIGAQQRNKTKCLFWFYLRCTLLFFRVCFLIFYILAGITLIRKIPVIFTFFFRIYCLWLVLRFIEEIRQEELRKNAEGIVLENQKRSSKSEFER